ncbi:MAG: ABC transporter substrate-binding protein [Actinomycetota bacterium]
MQRTWIVKGSLVLGVAAAILVASCSSSSSTSSPTPGSTGATGSTGAVAKGGVYRVGVTTFGNTDGLDPTGEYGIPGWGLLDAIQRTLVTFKFTIGDAGTQLVPDLATEIPQPSSDGLTYTFHLKPGIKFGPPLDREITSADVAYAFQRLNTKPLVAEYGFYFFGVVKGMTGSAPAPTPISGIETPDPSTIVFHLTHPTGDFLYRLTLPATAPMPAEVAGCFKSAGGYGRDLVASGPYMIAGSPDVDASSCSTLTPMSGFDPAKSMTLVRNSSYDPSTDADSGRQANVDAIQITIDSSIADIFEKVQAGSLDASWYDLPPATVLQQYLTDPNLKDNVHAFGNGNVQFITMNMTHPPFDDVHVRKAVSYIIDKAALQKSWSGPISGDIATEIVPPYVLQGHATPGYDPYATPNEAGSLDKAMAEMKLSAYDANRDGKCDASVCKDLILVNQNIAPWTTMEPFVVQDLAKIGIQVVPRELETGAAYNTVQRVANDIPISMNANWAYDYADAYTYLSPMFDSSSISAAGNPNTTLTGLTAATAQKLGIPYPAGGVPSIDDKLAACEAKVGDDRATCWADLEKYLMEDVVPMVPYLWSNVIVITGDTVTHFEADPISQGTTFTQVAVNNDLPVPA